MCCCGLSEGATIVFIACWTIIQGICVGIISLLALLVHNCEITSMKTDQFKYFFYAVYFRDDDSCGATNWTFILGQPIPPDLTPEMNAVTDVAYRTNIFALVYFILSLMWIASSCMVIVAALASCLGRCTYYFLFLPWILTTIGIIVFDAIATGFFAYDLSNSFSLLSLLNHLDVINAQQIVDGLQLLNYESLDLYFIPALIMMGASSKVVILWFINIICLIIVCRNAKRITAEAPKMAYSNRKIIREPDFVYQQHQQPQLQEHQQQQQQQQQEQQSQLQQHQHRTTQVNYIPPQMQELNRYNDQAPNQYQYENPQYQTTDKNYNQRREQTISPLANESNNVNHQFVPAVIERRYLEPLKGGGSSSSGGGGGGSTHSDENLSTGKSLNSNSVDDSNRDTSLLKPIGLTTSYNNRQPNSPSHPRSTYQQQQSPQQHFHYPDTNMNDTVEYIPRAKPMQSAVIKQVTDQVKRDEQLKRMERFNTPEEVRNQLPWSYFQSRDDVSGPPKKTLSQNIRGDGDHEDDDHDDVLPPVPVPDYTLHFPKKERSSNSNFSAQMNAAGGGRSNNSMILSPPVSEGDGRWSGPEYRY